MSRSTFGVRLGIVLGGLTVSACGSDPVRPCDEPGPLATQEAAFTIDQVPADSLVGPLLYWPGGAVPAGTVQRLEELGIEVIHVFHYQPAILVGATGAQLRAFVAEDPTVDVQFGVRVVLMWGCQPS